MAKFGVSIAVALALVGIVDFPAVQAAQVATNQPAAVRDGQKDFDWEIGTWTTKVKVRRNPLSGAAPDWAEYEGTSVIKALLGGRARSAVRAAKSRADRFGSTMQRRDNGASTMQAPTVAC